MDGILSIDKPSSITSYGVVAAVKRICHERRVGHAGTLDPMATGVLPVCIGRATRVAEFLMESPKTYLGEVEFGITTDTGDAAGSIVQQSDPSSVGIPNLTSALAAFRGTIMQTPPMYSALKHAGQPLYRLARAGISVERSSRPAEIYELVLTSWEPPVAKLKVTCGRGTYIRSLAHDLGQMLGCGACLKSLVRLSYGPFDIAGCIALSDLQPTFESGRLPEILHPIDSVLMHWPALVVEADLEDDIRHGRPLSVGNDDSRFVTAPSAVTGEHCRAYSLDGCFLGVLRFNSEKAQWQPEKVFL